MTTPLTWTHVIHGPGYWGCGNSVAECFRNLPSWVDHKAVIREAQLFTFGQPVSNVVASPFGIQWQWTDPDNTETMTHNATDVEVG
jgi:hypothetical protein